MQLTENESAPFPDTRDEPPAKRRRGRPRTSNETATETKSARSKKQAPEPPSQDEAAGAKKPVRRGRPRGSSRTVDNPAAQERAVVIQASMEEEDTNDQENENSMATKGTKTSRAAPKAKPPAAATATAARRRARAPSVAKQIDGEFEYTPTRTAQVQQLHPEPEVLDSQMHEDEPEVDESVLPEPPTRYASSSVVKNARARMATVRTQDVSPNKRKSGFGVEQGVDPDLRRRIGDLTKKHDGLEAKYRNLREIGIVEANTNMDKLRKQCQSITTGTILAPNPMFAERH
jgi:hypothetical protein